VPLFFVCTFAPGTAAPEASVTVPMIVPVACALNRFVPASDASNTMPARNRANVKRNCFFMPTNLPNPILGAV